MKPNLNPRGHVRTNYITKINPFIEKVVHKTPTLGCKNFWIFIFFTDNGGVNSIDTVDNNYSVPKQFKQTVLVYI